MAPGADAVADRSARFVAEVAAHQARADARAGEVGLPRVSRARFVASKVADLVVIDGATGEVHVSPRPAGMSDRAYRDHLSGQGLTVRVREADTQDLPERAWGGAVFETTDPVSAQAVAEKYLKQGWIVSVTWSRPDGERS